jgi:preprotein translocase SecE subunit
LATETIEQTGDGPRSGPRVTWPTRREVYATTLVVILTSVFFGVYLFGVDLMFSLAIQWVLQRFGAGAV